MKTTIDIPDDLACEAMDAAARDDATLCDLVLAGLRSEVDRRAQVRSGRRYPGRPGQDVPDLHLQDTAPGPRTLPD